MVYSVFWWPPVIDWTLNVGSIIQLAVLVVGGVAAFFAVRTDVRVIRHDVGNLKQRQDDLNEAFTQLGTILTRVAVQDERLVSIERRVDELRHGQGFVNPMRS